MSDLNIRKNLNRKGRVSCQWVYFKLAIKWHCTLQFCFLFFGCFFILRVYVLLFQTIPMKFCLLYEKERFSSCALCHNAHTTYQMLWNETQNNFNIYTHWLSFFASDVDVFLVNIFILKHFFYSVVLYAFYLGSFCWLFCDVASCHRMQLRVILSCSSLVVICLTKWRSTYISWIQMEHTWEWRTVQIRRWNEKTEERIENVLHKKTANEAQMKWMKKKKKENRIETNCEKNAVHQPLLLKTKGLHAHFIWKFFPIYLNEAHYLILFRFIFHIYNRIHFFRSYLPFRSSCGQM